VSGIDVLYYSQHISLHFGKFRITYGSYSINVEFEVILTSKKVDQFGTKHLDK